MKKTFPILILIALLTLVLVPNVAFAATNEAGPNLCLIRPVAITLIDNKIFVADNVDETNNQSVILCFDVSNDTPKYCFTHSVNKEIVNLSTVDGNLCVIYADGFDLVEVSENSLTVKQTYNEVDVKDVTYAGYPSGNASEYTLYYLGGEQSQHLYYYNKNNKFIPVDSHETVNSKACLDFGNYVYFLYGHGACLRFDCVDGYLNKNDDEFNKSVVYATGFVPKGMFQYNVGSGNQLAMFGDSGVYYMTYDTSDNSHFAVNTVLLDYTNSSGKTIVDMHFGADKIFLLNSANQVEIYRYENNEFVCLDTTIGTDKISLNIAQPTEFTGFTLAKSLGYPTNIVYKTDWDNSIEDIKKDFTDEIVILDFDGADQLSYYYVLLGDKFGWIKKSDGANISAQNDEKIAVVNNKVGTDGTFKAKFISLNSVSVYDLPLGNSNRTVINQDVTNPQDVTVLQKFSETASDGTVVDWYYVAYGNDAHGFVQSGNIGHFYPAGSIENSGESVIGYKKINSSILEAVKIYLTSEMVETEAICNEHGDPVKLYSGSRVVAVREEGNATFVEIRKNDGSTTYGWMESKNLIGLHTITTNSIVGLSILAAAIVLAILFWIMFVKKKRTNVTNENEQ